MKRPLAGSSTNTHAPGLEYRSSALRSQISFGVPPAGAEGSIIQTRCLAPRDSRSFRNAVLGETQLIPPKRYSVWTNGVAAPVNGADNSETGSRLGTVLRGFPLSNASTITSVAGASGR